MMKMEKAVSIALTLTLLLSMLIVATPKVSAQATTVEFSPSLTEIHTLNQEFTVSCRINDVTDLAGFDLKVSWDTSYIILVDHAATLKCLVSPTFTTKDVVDDPGLGPGTYWLAAATLSGTGFTGSDEAFWAKFRAINVPYGNAGEYVDTMIHIMSSDLANSAAQPIDHTNVDGTVRIYKREFVYPPEPLLKVDSYAASSLGEHFPISVTLMGNGGGDLDAFWDVAGIDVVMHYNTTVMNALSVTIDPDGTFASFWPGGIYLLIDPPEIDHVAGTVHVAFMGIPGGGGSHTAPFGKIKMFTVTFNATIVSTSFPTPSEPITLKNPTAFTGDYAFDAIGGKIDLNSPVGTTWTKITPGYGEGPYTLTASTGSLAEGKTVEITGPGGFYFNYLVNHITGTLNLTLARTTDPVVWPVIWGPANLKNNGLPGYTVGGGADPYDGFGVANWYGNFSVKYPVKSVNKITVHALPFSAEAYTYDLVEGVDYKVHDAENTIELLHGIDVNIVNEHVGTMPDVALGWPAIEHPATSFINCKVDFHNGTFRNARDFGFEVAPPAEYWFEPEWSWELESWWATGYFPGPWVWPDGTDIYLNYTAASYMTIDYNTDPATVFVDYAGTYAQFLAINDPTGTTWNEIYPYPWRTWTWSSFVDSDTSGTITVGDFVIAPGGVYYRIDGVHTDIQTSRYPWICEVNPTDKYYGWAPIVSIAGFPHPENWFCPWHSHDYSVPLPHYVENGVYTVPYKPLGGFIDVYTQYPDPYGGQGKDQPSDMFYPQKEVLLHVNVTYAGWPEQRKDVAIEVKRPVKDQNGNQIGWQLFTVLYGRTDENGMVCIPFRLPWPCDNPESYFGIWKVWATVDVACKIVNDTMLFKYDYRVRIFNVVVDPPYPGGFKHSDYITIHVTYGSQFIQKHLYSILCNGTKVDLGANNVTITMTVLDASGVPVGFAYMEVTLGIDDMKGWCQYYGGTVDLQVPLPKWTRPGAGTIYVGALNDFPQNGGSAETPVYAITISILAQ